MLAPIGEILGDRDAREIAVAIDNEHIVADWLVLEQDLLGRADIGQRGIDAFDGRVRDEVHAGL